MPNNWTATYRLQVHAGFPLSAAEAILPYLRDLGISHVYLSPVLQAAPGSDHGYDVSDPSKISEFIGGEDAWRSFQDAVKAIGLKVLVDIVPNHMTTATPANHWWDDVLAHGPFSAEADTFDIMPYAISERWLVSICTLGEPYGNVLAAGQLTVDLATGLPRLRYFDTTWPLGPASWRPLVTGDLLDLVDTLERIRLDRSPGKETIETYRKTSEKLTAAVRDLIASDDTRATMQATCDALAAAPDSLHTVIEHQYYRLCWWKLEGEIVNYRRFFNIGTLIGLRVEEPRVFEAAHARIEQMIADGDVDGLRVDHPDGLHDPRGYFRDLRELLPDGRIYAEKILDGEEELPADWPIDGTVGYGFLSKVNRLWIDEHKADAFTAAYADFTGHSVNYPALVREKKLEMVDGHFRADLERLTTLALHAAQSRWRTHDLSRAQMREAIKLLTVALPVYRTYLTPEEKPAGPIDEKIIEDAVAQARAQATGIEPEVFQFLEDLLTNELEGKIEDEFIGRWQQVAPAVMAKGAEDTTFYCYDRLVSCNEVGSQPSSFGISTEAFHQFCSKLHASWPHNLLATSTHDNKRSEDVRTRIDVMTEVPERWTAAANTWSELNQAAWNGRTPDRHAEYLLYQTLVGAWPITPERAWAYMLKACREAKIETTWHEPNAAYEDSIRDFTYAILANPEFVTSLEEFITPLIEPGRINGLSQTLIKMTAPGTPDFYQGTELWDLSLVDPDNRRPVDYEARTAMLARVNSIDAATAMQEWDTGLPKLWMIQKTLAVRASHAHSFSLEALYQPRSARGSRLGHIVTYQRGEDIMVIVPRFNLALDGDWADTVIGLPAGTWANAFTGAKLQGELSPSEIFATFPTALLVRE